MLSLFSEISLSLFTICRFKSISRSALIKKSISWVGLLLVTSVYGVELKNEWSNIIISHSTAGMTLGILERPENWLELEETEDRTVMRKAWPIFQFHGSKVQGPNHYQPHTGDWGTNTCIWSSLKIIWILNNFSKAGANFHVSDKSEN